MTKDEDAAKRIPIGRERLKSAWQAVPVALVN